jgi:hypothetical protein
VGKTDDGGGTNGVLGGAVAHKSAISPVPLRTTLGGGKGSVAASTISWNKLLTSDPHLGFADSMV